MTDRPDRDGTTVPVPRSVVVAVVALDAVPDWDRVTGMLAPGNHESPAFRHRVVDVPFGLEAPRWAGDPDSDPPWHLDRVSLPPHATFADVLDFARTAPPAPGVRHPLWGLTLLDGLTGGRSALVIRLHHLAAPDDDTGDLVRSWARSATRGLTRTATSVVKTLLGEPADTPDRRTASDHSPNRHFPYRLHVVDVPLAALRVAADRANCGLESGFAAAMLLACAAYRHRQGRKADNLRAAIPVSTGHPVTVELLDSASNPDELMRRIETDRTTSPDGTDARPADAQGLRGEPVTALSNSEALFGAHDVLTATLPGSSAPLYIGGAKVERYYGFGPTHGAAFNATLMSYRAGCGIGVTVDPGAVPDRDVFDECLRSGVEAVVGSAGDPGVDPAAGQSG
ncbi:wax ester/triacylglycerol synthase domain-containing protein [Rhodococcus sp. (in: high G+C Gram-positive bacteria)]|uniref:wax ester/triacylglycerol synthase domain-containing protein n=1 Tax=Rhodococcus sp. TaxID=1831 RepID=UPI00388F491C